MALDLRDCTLFGPALPEPFVKLQLESHLKKRELLPKATGEEAKTLQASWEIYRRRLRMLGEQGGDRRVASHVLEPLTERLGYATFTRSRNVLTREGDEEGGWHAARRIPDSYRLLLALASPAGARAVPELTEQARLAQATVTKKLRLQARRAVERFIQEVLDHPANAEARAGWTDTDAVARQLWSEGLKLIYRLLFIFKLESSADPARAFSFAATSLWRNTYSPNVALAPHVRRVLDEGADTGGMLEAGLRTLFRMFVGGLSSSELQVSALGGMLFGEGTTPLLDGLAWGERAVASLLDALLWTPAAKKGKVRAERERVHYGSLDVEDLGRVYEALLELSPGIATEPMCRLRRAKLEVVVPEVQGEPYRNEDGTKKGGKTGKKTKVEWIEAIPSGRFFLRVGLGRKASGSYYTPHPFVRFLVQETLGQKLDERSPRDDPQPGRILELKVLDPAMGSGHFLVEACRYLGEALYGLPSVQAALNAQGIVPLFESKSLHQFDANWAGAESSAWNPVPQHGYPVAQVQQTAIDKAVQVGRGARYYRMCLRETCGSPHTNERSAVGAVLPPGVSAFHSAIIEQRPAQVVNAARLTALAVVNSFTLDFVARFQIGAHFSLFILAGLPWPALIGTAERFLAHAALRLTCNHAGYAPLWTEQLGDAWREPRPKHTWPVLEGDDQRWAVRAAIDAVVAGAYGLSREQYEQVFAEKKQEIDQLIDLLVPMDSQQAEIVATLYACWNDLLAGGRQPSDDAIIEDFYAWHASKRTFNREHLERALPWMRSKGLVPTGRARMTLARGEAHPKKGRKHRRATAPDHTLYQAIATLLAARGVITSRDAQEATGLDAAGVRPYLERLVDECLVVKEGQARGTKYRRVRDA